MVNMWAADTDHRSVARFVGLIPETFVNMIVRFLNYSHETAVYRVGVMTCVHCYQDLSLDWQKFVKRTYNKVLYKAWTEAATPSSNRTTT